MLLLEDLRLNARLTLTLGAALALGACTLQPTVPPEFAAARTPAPGEVRLYAVGDIADCGGDPPERAMARRTAGLVPEGSTVLALGDIAYPLADAATLRECFDATWGEHRANTLVVAGNHDYVQGSTRDLRAHFGLDALAADAGFVAYARNLSPAWRLIVLDSTVGGEAMQRQREWFERTLAVEEEATACLLVAWHTPVQSSGWHRGSGKHMRPFWQLLDEHEADLVLSGHEHFYEAFAPFDGELREREDGNGIRQFTVGTGGAHLWPFVRPPYASRARVLEHGVLELTLGEGDYTWRFLDVDGAVRDAGQASCRRQTATPRQDLRR